MDLGDILTSPTIPERPINPDMDRIMEIVLEMRAITSEHKHDSETFNRKWREHITKYVDFDALAYQAMQVALSIMEIQTGYDFIQMRQNRRRRDTFVQIMQGFYDGFLLGAEFQEHGGHRER